MTNPDKKPREFYIHECVPLLGENYYHAYVEKPNNRHVHETTKLIHVIEYSAHKKLEKENEELKLALFDRSEKYKIAMDKGVLQLRDEIKSLRSSLKLAVEAYRKYAKHTEDCNYHCGPSVEYDCNCGLDDAIAHCLAVAQAEAMRILSGENE